MNNLRIVSFLPAATEMAYALGLADQLVGVSHECDFPADAKTKPVVVRCSLPVETMSLNEIDVAVAECIGRGGNLYEVDQPAIEQLAPTHILTQALCQVCAPSNGEIARALKALPSKPQILWFTPHCIEAIFDNLRELGTATGRLANAYFARPGPRVVDGVELLAHLIHPELFEWNGPVNAFRVVQLPHHPPSTTRTKTCPECSQAFECKMGGCWCEGFPPLPPSTAP